MKLERLRTDVAQVGRELVRQGLVTGTAGNVSAFDPTEVLVAITPSGVDYGDITPEDVVLLDLEGDVIEGDFKPSSETPMHLGVYKRRPDVGGIVHTHSPIATTLACLGREIPPIYYYMARLGDRVPVAEYALYGTERMGVNAARALGSTCKATLLAHHGVLATGKTVQEAQFVADTVEFVAGIYYRILAMGLEPQEMTPADLAAIREKSKSYGQTKR